MRIAIGSDEKTHLTSAVAKDLRERGHTLQLHGALSAGESLWPAVGQAVGEQIASGKCREGILFCWTGTGVCIAANKVPGVRAALCLDAETAKGARRWDHANVLVMSLRSTPEPVAKEILDAWFATSYSSKKEDLRAVAMVRQMERKYSRVKTSPSKK